MNTSFGLLSTYPPTQCGVAAFAGALGTALSAAPGVDRVGVVRVVDSPTFTDRPEVIAHLQANAAGSSEVAAAALDRHDVVIVNHEYGIYDGNDGDGVLDLLHRLRSPSIIVLHTVKRRPTPHQQWILETVASLAGAVVITTESARKRLHETYTVDPAKVHVIPHGALVQPAIRTVSSSGEPMVLTWGLLGPGKGVEWAIVGMREVRHLSPRPRYVISGQTHPKVLAEEGESYRLGLYKKVRAFGVADLVRFERSYADPSALARLVDRADVVVLPYDTTEQVSSGVLHEAVAAGKPVIATPFPHAVELLGTGAGLLVPHRDGAAIGAALKRLLTDPDLVAGMRAEALRRTAGADWDTIATRYTALATVLQDATSKA
ncbi:glycosyltransferase [Dactylosporangium sp. NBC_01737]|uniref:glycosyltransferase n=1 Tax=Dactylosporangium sp. NBC_01737 TaxID=2975959 RepID=UPI002E0DBAC1|nr:glycosyltransferase [Dactylosporangium sp. NBC_01737]